MFGCLRWCTSPSQQTGFQEVDQEMIDMPLATLDMARLPPTNNRTPASNDVPPALIRTSRNAWGACDATLATIILKACAAAVKMQGH
jgi:hypothetical protein